MHDEIAIASVIGRQSICGHYLQGGALTHSQPGQFLKLIDLVVDGCERKSRIGGNESASYVVPNDATADIISLIQICFGLVSVSF